MLLAMVSSNTSLTKGAADGPAVQLLLGVVFEDEWTAGTYWIQNQCEYEIARSVLISMDNALRYVLQRISWSSSSVVSLTHHSV